MRILVCNDDGIAAPGLADLASAAATLDATCGSSPPSANGRRQAINCRSIATSCSSRVGERAYACSGAPADCVVAAMTVLFADGPSPIWCSPASTTDATSREDIAYSGTMAIAREATFWGVPAISVSRVKDALRASGDDAALRALLRTLWGTRGEWAADGHWLGVNLPRRCRRLSCRRRSVATKSLPPAMSSNAGPTASATVCVAGAPIYSAAGDENDAIGAGNIVVARHGWAETAVLPEDLVACWNRALR